MPKGERRDQNIIDREKAQKLSEIENIDSFELLAGADELGSRHYSRECKKILRLRKALLLVEKKRQLKGYTNQEAYEEMVQLVYSVLPTETTSEE